MSGCFINYCFLYGFEFIIFLNTALLLVFIIENSWFNSKTMIGRRLNYWMNRIDQLIDSSRWNDAFEIKNRL